MPSKTCDRKSSAMTSRHSCGPVARVGVLGRGLRWWARLDRFPVAQGPPGRVLREQEAQGGGARARKAEPDEGGDDLLFVDLGVKGVPLLDVEPVDQVADDLVAHRGDAQLVERSLGCLL